MTMHCNDGVEHVFKVVGTRRVRNATTKIGAYAQNATTHIHRTGDMVRVS
jgi:hypothetical protein